TETAMRLVHRNLQKPGSHTRGLAKLADVPQGLDEGVLNDIVRVGTIAHEPERGAPDGLDVAAIERLPRPGLAGHQAVCQIDVADRRDDALLHREWSRVSAVGEERSHPRSTHRGGPRAGGSGSRWKMPPLASGFVPWSVAAREEPVGRPSGPLAPGLRRTLSAEAEVREAVVVHV